MRYAVLRGAVLVVPEHDLGKLVVARFTYENIGDEPLDLLCGGTDLRLLDDRDRKFSPSDDNFGVAETRRRAATASSPATRMTARRCSRSASRLPLTALPGDDGLGRPGNALHRVDGADRESDVVTSTRWPSLPSLRAASLLEGGLFPLGLLALPFLARDPFFDGGFFVSRGCCPITLNGRDTDAGLAKHFTAHVGVDVWVVSLATERDGVITALRAPEQGFDAGARVEADARQGAIE